MKGYTMNVQYTQLTPAVSYFSISVNNQTMKLVAFALCTAWSDEQKRFFNVSARNVEITDSFIKKMLLASESSDKDIYFAEMMKNILNEKLTTVALYNMMLKNPNPGYIMAKFNTMDTCDLRTTWSHKLMLYLDPSMVKDIYHVQIGEDEYRLNITVGIDDVEYEIPYSIQIDREGVEYIAKHLDDTLALKLMLEL